MVQEVPDAAGGRIAAEGFGEYRRGRVRKWEVGLPNDYELFPLTKPLVSPALASAFRIGPEPSRTAVDVDRQSPVENDDEREEEEEGSDAVVPCVNYGIESSHPKRLRVETLSALRTENSIDERSARSQKRPRVVWTPQLHKRFVDVVTRLGTEHAVPKAITQLMNVEGLTRANVASHLQKYRIYVRSKAGLSSEGPSSSDCDFASMPVPQSFREHHYQLYQTPPQTVPLPYTMSTMLPKPFYSVPHGTPMVMVPFVKSHHSRAIGERPMEW